ncbi:hypothetical protein TWF694_000584 [Orbilia ellipsospora]|uniref:Uncharacterized protein n=1 Tax=Orbilia ellipsospora TaxID=2528407 RepID=A0AAV9XP13_9PEZI
MENLPRGRRSRRSSSNLNLSNISPLTTHFSLTALADVEKIISPQSSYIQGISAPSTPSILSRETSRKRTRTQITTLSVPGTPRPDVKLTKAKSASHLLVGRRKTSQFHTHTVRRNESTEWVHRAGIALTSEARESKGQSWLARRESSTSLLSNGDSDSEEEGEGSSRKIPTRGSRSQLEFTRLRIDIPEEDSVHPLAPEFIDETFIGSSFDEDGDSGELDDDDEDLHWSKRPRNGLGAWVDRMVGWSLFSLDEDVDSDEDQEHEPEEKVHDPPRLSIPNFETGKAEPAEQPEAPQLQDGSVWADAGWVLGLAAKVIFQ